MSADPDRGYAFADGAALAIGAANPSNVTTAAANRTTYRYDFTFPCPPLPRGNSPTAQCASYAIARVVSGFGRKGTKCDQAPTPAQCLRDSGAVTKLIYASNM